MLIDMRKSVGDLIRDRLQQMGLLEHLRVRVPNFEAGGHYRLFSSVC